MYEIDEVFPVIEKAQELTGRRYGADEGDDVRFRVVADHVRSGLMLMGDGVTPGNEGRGYVLRRLLRRAVRSMRLLGCEDRVLPELMPVSRDKMGETYTDLLRDWERIARVAYAEEDAFRATLRAGTQIFDLAAGEVKKSGGHELSGERAFALHDTYGFPIDLTLEMASEQGLSVDEDGFRALMTQQRERAKADARAKKGQHADTHVYREVLDAHGPTEWLAYETLSTESRPLALISRGDRVTSLGEGEVGELILDRTPFYAESGGQAADAGTITFDGGSLEVLDVQRPVRGLVVHQIRVVDGELVSTGSTGGQAVLHAQVDPEWRTGARQAHSGTHVVHAALRERPRPDRSPVGLLQPTRIPAARLRLDPVADAGAAARHRAGLAAGAAPGPARRLAVHDAGAGQGLGCDRAVRREVRRHRARRRHRRPLVARALRRHPRRPFLADRHHRRHRRVVRGLREPAHRGVHRRGGFRLPRA